MQCNEPWTCMECKRAVLANWWHLCWREDDPPAGTRRRKFPSVSVPDLGFICWDESCQRSHPHEDRK